MTSVPMVVLLAALAQAPAPETIGRLLASNEPQTVAWGIHAAGAYHRTESIPRLVQLLESPPQTSARETHAFRSLVLDALIRLDARVPAALIVHYLDTHPVHVFVLLSDAPGRDAALRELIPRLSGINWFAAANILLKDRSSGLVEHLVETVTLSLTVHVVDDENVGIGLAGTVAVSIACGIGENPEGYPPHTEYRFASLSAPGHIVLAPGPHEVYYTRTVKATRQYGICRADSVGPSDEDRVSYLHAAASDISGTALRAHTVETVPWSNAMLLTQRVQELRERIVRRLRELVDRARTLHPGTPQQLTSPGVSVQLVDRRTDKTVPLPPVDR